MSNSKHYFVLEEDNHLAVKNTISDTSFPSNTADSQMTVFRPDDLIILVDYNIIYDL